MNESVYDDLALEQIAKTRFGMAIEIDHVIVRGIPVSRVATATLFLTTKKQLLLYVTGTSILLLADVKKNCEPNGSRGRIIFAAQGTASLF